MKLAPSGAPGASRPPLRAARRAKWLVAAIAVLAVPLAAHLSIRGFLPVKPPTLAGPERIEPQRVGGVREIGAAYARKRGKILEVRLAGTPDEVGRQHGSLLRGEMLQNEGELYKQFEHFVPSWPLRWLILDLSQLRFRNVADEMTAASQTEIAAQARSFAPDPFGSIFPTYQRFVFLQALYDISLSFEHSPLLGCTSFALTDGAAEGGHSLLGRNFDFEAGPIFDEGKAVFIVHEAGRIPYASVAWPGLIGAVTGVNAEGLALVVHGARARKATSIGEPVLLAMRDVLATQSTVRGGFALLSQKRTMVSHMVMLVDRTGEVAVVERAPGEAATARFSRGRVPLTNHLEGPLSSDPANQAIRQKTSTLARRNRLDELLARLPNGASPAQVAEVLRDKRASGGAELPLGDRDAIDALIATHSVIIDVDALDLWVNEGPHLTGRFIKFDLKPAFDITRPPENGGETYLQADAIATDGSYLRWTTDGARHSSAGK